MPEIDTCVHCKKKIIKFCITYTKHVWLHYQDGSRYCRFSYRTAEAEEAEDLPLEMQ